MRAWTVAGFTAQPAMSLEAAVSSCLESSNHSPNLPCAQGLKQARATGAGNADPPKQHNGGFTETKRLLGNPSTVLSLSSSMSKNPMAQFPASTNISSKVSQAVQKRG